MPYLQCLAQVQTLTLGEFKASLPKIAATNCTSVTNRLSAEQTLSEHILPLPALSKDNDDSTTWTEQLLTTLRHLEPPQVANLLALSNLGLSYAILS